MANCIAGDMTTSRSLRESGKQSDTRPYGTCRCPGRLPNINAMIEPTPPALPVTLLLLSTILGFPELVLGLADAGLLGTPRWRSLAVSYGGLWPGLWRDWTPNYAAQPVTMLLSYSLIHSGPFHAASNIAGVWLFGAQVRASVGAGRLWAVWLVAVLGGALAPILFYDSPRPVIGASGGVYGLVAVWILRRQNATRRGTVLIFAALLGLEAGNWWLFSGEIAWSAHLGGLLGGMAMVACMPVRRRDPAPP